jgi:hypothetical protein
MIKINDRAMRVVFWLSLSFFISQIFLIIFFWRHLPPQGPLYYSRPWGEKQQTTPQGVLILPLLSLAVIVVNLIIASLVTKEEKLISQLLVFFTAVFNFLCFFTLLKIFLLIT